MIHNALEWLQTILLITTNSGLYLVYVLIGCYEYKVQAQVSDSMNLIEAKGKCLLALTPNNEIVCATLTTRQILGVWPYDSLRRYWCGQTMFGFEAGRRSPRGEGLFTFGTDRDEQLYRTLEKCIVRAKKGGTDSRPPAPLPSNSTNSDTPPVSTSESDEDESPLLPSIPNRLPRPNKTQSVRAGGGEGNMSGPSPAQLRRMKTHTGIVTESHKWLHQSVDSRPVHEQYEPPPTVRMEEDTQESTYSHTVHTFPAPFQKRMSQQTVSSGSTYHRLHSQPPATAPTGTTAPVAGYSDLPEEDMRVYDVAFQPDPSGNTQTIPTEGQYTILGQPDPSRVVREPSKVPGPSLGDPLSSKKSPPRRHSDDTLTSNPLYGSQDNLLHNDNLRAAIRKLEDQGHNISDPPQLPPRNKEIGVDNIDVGTLELDDQDLEINPVYGEHSTLTNQPEKLYPLNPTYAVHSIQGQTKPLNKHDSKPDHESPSRESTPSTQETEGEVIKRDVKGYSKVDKSKKNKREDSDDDSGTPPPLPERLYEDDVGDTNIEN